MFRVCCHFCAVVTTVAGSGISQFFDATGSQASFDLPTGVAVDASGNVFVAAFSDQRVRKINPAGGAHVSAHVGSLPSRLERSRPYLHSCGHY